MATKKKVQIIRSSGNVFEDIGFGREEAEHLKIRSALMAAIVKLIKVRKLTQSSAAALFGVTQPRISDLVRGKIDLFSIDTLVEMLAKAEVHVEVRVQMARSSKPPLPFAEPGAPPNRLPFLDD